MRIIAFIFARGGSKGLPKKNIKLFCGMPLIAHSIRLAQSIKVIDDIIVSTDDEQIAQIAKHYGANVPFLRPIELANDDTPEFLAWQHGVRWVLNHQSCFDIFISLPTTAPLRNADDIKKCLDLLTDDVDMVLTCRLAERNPYFNMIKEGQDGYVELVNQQGNIFSRQAGIKIYDLTTVAYVTRPDFILNNNSIFDGKTKAVLIPKERATDIDDKWDFALAELIAQKKYAQK